MSAHAMVADNFEFKGESAEAEPIVESGSDDQVQAEEPKTVAGQDEDGSDDDDEDAIDDYLDKLEEEV